MDQIPWQFPAILFGAMVLTACLSFLQVQRYNQELQAALVASTGADDVLISGRCRSWRGGSIVVMVVDRATQEVTRATAMTGCTVLARFRPRPELLGPVATVAGRARGRALREGVEHALAQMPTPRRALSDESPLRTARRSRSATRFEAVVR